MTHTAPAPATVGPTDRGTRDRATDARTEGTPQHPAPTSAPDHAADVADVRRLVQDRAAAFRAGDAERLVADLLPDAVLFTLAPPLAQPAAAAHDVGALRAWFAGHGGRVGYEVTDLVVRIDGDLALCHSIDRMGAPDDTPGHRFDLWFRTTLGLCRVGGRWRVAHQHQSTPFHMDGSFRAAVDLRPGSDGDQG
ncbi:YybH family protein [Nakamurella endophytica]|uniref:SnoaL-like domain-containing protein n=1 Tax=Nakamurella endophytica TaxID=1748367 RepID=A0A917T0U1_9ACTN|nr:nuclear transport factor 2 family protein [Nakamurella endophytica]GGM06802.1 hypothetical protein GCM10011594_28540 [Nakamurella endophytica]